MIGATLSRWTVSYFAAALGALIAAEALMAAGFGFPQAEIRSPDTLVVVHLVTIGWLSLAMCGALLQFVPVLTTGPLYSNLLPLPALACLIAGLAALLLGFLQLGGRFSAEAPFLAIGATLLGVGFGLTIWNLGATLWKARPLPLAARFVCVGLISLGATVGYGIAFALGRGETATGASLLSSVQSGLPIHVAAGLGGWMTFTAAGVSHRLLAMFMLAPDLNRAGSRATFWSGTFSLSVLIAGGATALLLRAPLGGILSFSGLLALIALALYGRDILHLYRNRKRRVLELNSRMAAVALSNLAASVLLIVTLLLLRSFYDHVGAAVFLVVFGWLSGFVLAKLYKIVAFLTWLECYGPVLGRTPTPRVQDLVVEQRAIKWFWLYYGAVWSATVALLFDASIAFRASAFFMAIATCGITCQLARTRRLMDVAAANPLPAGAATPSFLRSLSSLTRP